MKGRSFEAKLFEPDEEERSRLSEMGVVRIPLEVPWPIEPVNVLVVEGETPALIDTGLRYLDNLERLEKGLASANLCLEDLGEIWITHPHIDHFGLTEEIVARSGAKVMAFVGAHSRFDHYMTYWKSDREWLGATFAASGVPSELVSQMLEFPSLYAEMGGAVSIDQTFEDGEHICIAGRKARAFHVPGHSPWCSAFWFEQEEWLASGDALLERITSNPILYPPTVGPDSWQGITSYRNSLQLMAGLPAKWVLPGHGRSFRGHEQSIQRALDAQRRRQTRIIQVMEKGIVSPFQIAETLFGSKRAQNSIFLVMSEVLRHLDWLVAEEKALFEQTPSLWQYHLKPSLLSST